MQYTAPPKEGMEQLFRRNPLVETAPLQQEAILYHPGLNRFCILNRTSSFIWSRLESPVSPQQIAAGLSESFDQVTIAQALDDVRLALDDLRALDLVSSVSDSDG